MEMPLFILHYLFNINKLYSVGVVIRPICARFFKVNSLMSEKNQKRVDSEVQVFNTSQLLYVLVLSLFPFHPMWRHFSRIESTNVVIPFPLKFSYKIKYL